MDKFKLILSDLTSFEAPYDDKLFHLKNSTKEKCFFLCIYNVSSRNKNSKENRKPNIINRFVKALGRNHIEKQGQFY